MTTPENALRLERLAAKGQELQARGHLLEASEVLGEMALLHTASGDIARAAASLGMASQLCATAGDRKRQLSALRGQGQLLVRLPGQEREGQRKIRQAVLIAKSINDVETETLGRKELAQILFDREDWRGAAGEAMAALQAQKRAGLPQDELTLQLHMLRASSLQMRQKFGHAAGELEKALEVALAIGNEESVLEVRLARHGAQALAEDQSPSEDLSEIVKSADAAGSTDASIQGRFLQASRALMSHQFRDAESIGLDLRKLTLAARDPINYLMSCLLIAEARQGLEDDVGIIEILGRAKNTLSEFVGPAAGQQVATVLSALPDRWGEERFEKAWATFQRKQEAGDYL